MIIFICIILISFCVLYKESKGNKLLINFIIFVLVLITISFFSSKFEDEELFTAISNSPNINNLKNDFAIWGSRKSTTGDDLPIHARYAIDKKPFIYNSLDEITYSINEWDWRELIYQMALDFYKHNQESDYLLRLEELNP